MIKLVFPSSVKLDGGDMIIDHVEIDHTVTTLRPTGSCELMHPAIFKAVRRTLNSKGVTLAGYKCTLTSGPNEGAAFMEYYHINQELSDEVQKCVRAVLQ